MQRKTIIGYLATDSDNWQYLHKREPKRLKYKNSLMNEDYPDIPVKGEWQCRKHYKKETGLHKFLLGKKFLDHTWFDNPVKTTITIQEYSTLYNTLAKKKKDKK